MTTTYVVVMYDWSNFKILYAGQRSLSMLKEMVVRYAKEDIYEEYCYSIEVWSAGKLQGAYYYNFYNNEFTYDDNVKIK